jgi:hypothetical protein
LKGIATQAQGAFGAFRAQADAMRSLMDTYQGTTDQTTALVAASQDYYAAAVQVVAQIEQIKSAMGDMFGGTIRSLTLQTLDNPGKYNFLRSEADSARAQMMAATDPETVQRLSNLVNQDITQAFSLLDPDAQRAKLPEFTAYINNVNAQATRHLNDISTTIQQATHDTLTESQNMVLAAKDIKDAASDMSSAASTIAQSHVDVDVNFTANVPGTAETNVG